MPGVLNNMDKNVSKPDLSSFVELCARQLAAAMQGARRESALLAEDLIAAADLVDRIGPAEKDSAFGPEDIADAGMHRQLRDRVNGVVLRMQFADRLDQQIDNVRKNLILLAEYVGEGNDAASDNAWLQLLQRARQSFTMEQERFFFDSVLGDAQAAKSADRTCSYALVFDEGEGDA